LVISRKERILILDGVTFLSSGYNSLRIGGWVSAAMAENVNKIWQHKEDDDQDAGPSSKTS
jgi:hypothetical protein